MTLHAEASLAQPRLTIIDANEEPGAPAMVHAGAMHGADVREYEALLQFLYLAPVGLVQLGADGAISMLNPLAAQLLMPLNQDGGLSNLFHALAPVAPDLHLLCRNFPAPHGQVCEGARICLHADGAASGPQVLSLSMLKLDAGRLMAVLNDITAQDRRERQLRNADAWLNAIMTNIADYALVSLDRRGRIESWNDSIGRVTGHGPDIKGQPYALFHAAGSDHAGTAAGPPARDRRERLDARRGRAPAGRWQPVLGQFHDLAAAWPPGQRIRLGRVR